MTRVIAHELDCPALCRIRTDKCQHLYVHDCTCHAAEELRVEVATAEEVLKYLHGFPTVRARLNAALAPFREEK